MSKISSSQVQKMSRGPGISSRSNIICRETLEHINACRAVGSNWSYTNAFALDRLIRRLMREGLWSRLSAACIAGADTLAGILSPIIGPPVTPLNLVSADYARRNGVRFGIGKSVQLGVAHNDQPQNDRSGAVWISEPATSAGTNAFIAAKSNGIGVSHLAHNPINGLAFARASGPILISANTAAPSGFFGFSRSNPDNFIMQLGGADYLGASQSVAPLAVPWGVGERNGVDFTDARLAWWHVGLSLDLAALRAALADYFAALV